MCFRLELRSVGPCTCYMQHVHEIVGTFSMLGRGMLDMGEITDRATTGQQLPLTECRHSSEGEAAPGSTLQACSYIHIAQ